MHEHPEKGNKIHRGFSKGRCLGDISGEPSTSNQWVPPRESEALVTSKDHFILERSFKAWNETETHARTETEDFFLGGPKRIEGWGTKAKGIFQDDMADMGTNS